jgi:hypothetical protein
MAGRKVVDERDLTPLGKRLLLAAKDASFSPTSLARAAELAGGHMTKLLYQPQSRIDLMTLERLCDLLGVRMHWLATGREPMREGGARTAVEEAMVMARGLGVTEDVFWFVRGRAGDIERTAQEWAMAFLEENKRRVEDAAYAREARRVAMREARKRPPPSEPRRKVARAG